MEFDWTVAELDVAAERPALAAGEFDGLVADGVAFCARFCRPDRPVTGATFVQTAFLGAFLPGSVAERVLDDPALAFTLAETIDGQLGAFAGG
jgi:hypothetical protein